MKNIREAKKILIRNRAILAIFLFAFVLRVVGIRHGLPLLLNEDETSFMRSVLGLRFSSNLNRFDWPHTHFFINYFFNDLLYYFRVFIQLIGLKDYFIGFFPVLWEDPQIFYMLGRLVNVFLGSLSVFPLFLLSKKLFNNKILWYFPPVLFTLIPFHIYDSAQALLDTAMTFWLIWFIYFCILFVKNASFKNFFLIGVFMGLAVGTKYYAVFYIFIFLTSLIYSCKSDFPYVLKTVFSPKYLKGYFVTFLGFVVSFFTFNYQVITNFDLFWSKQYGRGFLFQFDNVRTLPFSVYPKNLLRVVYTQPLYDLGFLLYSTVVIAILLYLFFKSYRNEINNLFIPTIVFVYFYFATKSRNPSHYFLFMYPLIVIAIADFVGKLSKTFVNIARYFTSHTFQYNRVLLSLLTVFVAVSLPSALKVSLKLYNPDTRNLARQWAKEKADKNLTVYYYGDSLNPIPFDNFSKKRITRLDDKNVNIKATPFYLVIGVNGVSYEDLVVNMSHPKINGWTSKFLKGSRLALYINNNFRYGPPIYIFKVSKVLKK